MRMVANWDSWLHSPVCPFVTARQTTVHVVLKQARGMPRAGRRRSVVWACFVENAASGKRRVFCRFCQHDLVANPIRMVRHIVKHCPSADEQHKKICREYQTLTVPLRRRDNGEDNDATIDPDPNAVLITDSTMDANNVTPHALPSEAAEAVIVSFGLPQPGGTDTHQPIQVAVPSVASSAIDESVADRVHEELVLALATTEPSPLQLLEHPRFVRALQLMNVPALTVAEIEKRVVPRLYNRVALDATAVLQAATTITVQITSMTVEGSAGFDVFASDHDLRQVPLPSLSSTASCTRELAALILSRIRPLPRKPACTLHLCTDIFSVSTNAFSGVDDPQRSQSSKEESQAIPQFVTGCLMQASLTLLAKVVETIPSIRRAVDACALLSQRVAVNSSLQNQLQGSSDSFAIFLLDEDSSLWSLLAVLGQVVRHQDALRSNAVSASLPCVLDDQFWSDVGVAHAILRPFGFLIALSDTGYLNASMVLVGWLLVWATALHSSVLSEDEKASVASLVLAHIERHGQPLTLVCLALDPRCRGLGLSALGKRKVRSLVVTTAQKLRPRLNQPALLEHVVKYLNSERPFDDEASWQMMASLPRLFWVEYHTEAHELASVALASLSFRPFIHSLQQTWALVSASVRSAALPLHSIESQASTLKRIAFQVDMMETSTSDHRKQALAIAARLLLTGSSISEPSTPTVRVRSDATSSYTSDLPTESPHGFWTRLDRVATMLSPGEDPTAINTSKGGESVDAAWFAADASDAVLQLETCLHRALFGEYVELRVGSPDHSDTDGARGDVDHVALSSVDESAPEMLSGLVGL